jgi:ribonuclease R
LAIKADSPFGKVIKVLGKPGEHDTEFTILAVWFTAEFPIEVENLAQKIDTSIEEARNCESS